MNMVKKRAFSLMEIMIVLVIVVVLFAILAPITTQRRSSQEFDKEPVWKEVPGSNYIYFHPGSEKMSSTAFFGVDPHTTRLNNSAKMVIKANDEAITPNGNPQRMIQFRYNNKNVGNLFMDDQGNLMVAGDNDKFVNNHKQSNYNTFAGIGAGTNLSKINNATAVGAYALAGGTVANSRIAGSKVGEFHPDGSLTAIGYSAGREIVGNKTTGMNGNLSERRMDSGIYIGSNTGRLTQAGKENIAIGAGALSSDFVPALTVALGYNTGSYFKQSGLVESIDNNRNVFVGTSNQNDPLITTSQSFGYNNFIGYRAGRDERYSSSASENSIMSTDSTAIGYQTLSGWDGNMAIGYQTGYKNNHNYSGMTLLGGTPHGGFGGMGVVEVYSGPNWDRKSFKDTVMLNSNLVVRGNLYVGKNTNDIYYNTYQPYFVPNTTNYNYGYCEAGVFKTGIKNTPWFGSKSFLSSPSANKCNSDIYGYNLNSNCPKLTTSDKRLKNIIGENNDGLNKILELKPYNFVYKNDKHKTQQVGVIAQDLQKIFPNSISKDKDGLLNIRWDEMFYALVNALKELDNKVQKIAHNITEIKNNIIEIQQKHKNIDNKISDIDKRLSRLERDIKR